MGVIGLPTVFRAPFPERVTLPVKRVWLPPVPYPYRPVVVYWVCNVCTLLCKELTVVCNELTELWSAATWLLSVVVCPEEQRCLMRL